MRESFWVSFQRVVEVHDFEVLGHQVLGRQVRLRRGTEAPGKALHGALKSHLERVRAVYCGNTGCESSRFQPVQQFILPTQQNRLP